MRPPVCAAMLLLAACSVGREGAAGTPDAVATGASPSDSALPAAPAIPGAARQACSATGRWSVCAVTERLDRAGLAPRRESGQVHEPPLAEAGTLVRVGNAELKLFIYPDQRAREQDEARLDRSRYVDASVGLTMHSVATVIDSGNLLALLFSKNDHQRERVSDAITAGPPKKP